MGSTFVVSEEILVEVKHVQAHHTRKDKKEMSHFEKFGKGRCNTGYGGSKSTKRYMQRAFTVW